MQKLIVCATLLLALWACDNKSHQHGTTTTATTAATQKDSSKTIAPADKSKQIIIGAGFGWRKKVEQTTSGDVDIELSLSYGYKIFANKAYCDITTNKCFLASFELKHKDEVLFSFPAQGGSGKMNIDLKATEMPCLVKKGEQVAIILPLQQGETEKSITIDVIKIENGKFVELLKNVAPYTSATLSEAEATSIFAKVF
jgi:hypothetical protein